MIISEILSYRKKSQQFWITNHAVTAVIGHRAFHVMFRAQIKLMFTYLPTYLLTLRPMTTRVSIAQSFASTTK